MDRSARAFDIVLLGATGFTGQLTAEQLARHLPGDARWALAGRNRDKLEQVRGRLAQTAPDAPLPDLVVVDTDRPDSLADLAASTRVLTSTVGPYLELGEETVAACAEAGTDYLDLTGEPEFIDRTWLRHHDTAVASGARLVHACGFDSVPHDLGAFFTVRHLPDDVPIRLSGVVRTRAGMSGGTLHSALGQFARAKQMREASKERRARESRPEGRRARARTGKVHRDRELDLWLAPLPTVDPVVVARSAAALDTYGPDFSYSHFAGIRKVRTLAAAGVGLPVLMAAAQVKPLREAIGRKLPQGAGPSPEQREKSWFTVDFLAEAGDQRLHTRVSGGDPGYTETSSMLAQSTLCLAFDDNPPTSGQVTTAVAMGDALLARLQAAGIRFEVL